MKPYRSLLSLLLLLLPLPRAQADHSGSRLLHARLNFVGAVGAHLRVRDNNFASALIMLLIAVAALTLRALSI